MDVRYSTFVIAGLGIMTAALIKRLIVLIFDTYRHARQKFLFVEARDNVQKHRAIVNFSVLGRSDLSARLISRTIPNRRLTEVFDILNPFTTISPTVYRQSVAGARQAIQVMEKDKSEWIDFFGVADTALGYLLNGIGNPLPLATTVRRLVFVAMLRPFFGGGGPKQVHPGDVLEATEMINLLWMESKNPSRPDLQQYQERLQAALQRILPLCFPCKREEHPLNTIIPAYETMWRVVLLTYVSAAFRATDRETTEQFRQVVDAFPHLLDSGINSELFEVALNFAKEGLRLYPPTKRIRRAVPRDPLNIQGSTDIVTPDIEECHRDVHIWGPDAEVFRPSRFNDLTDAMKEAYMPFGAGKHQCPTASKFGYRAIIILVVVLAKGLGNRDTTSIRFNNAKLDRDLSKVLPSGRMDMEDWNLEVNSFPEEMDCMNR
ncbi:hypothetical protein F5Y13DRAFT_197052 [Hypoxylon sp. FL1857]|nr:hypothetical protein F5Y13DRAFT_197052 [Hypoxylon sp. FL1857]